MDIIWNSKEAVIATGGRTTKTWKAGEIKIDSRKVTKGNLFVALKGINTDGHLFVQNALENGASAAIVEHIPENLDQSYPLLIVKNAEQALNDLGKYNHNRSSATFLAITGSVGKTSTKEMLRLAFTSQGKTYANYGNFNNNLGVPISLASMPTDTEYAIFEIGMNNPGEIIPLTKQVEPDIAIITNVEAVHLGNFNSVDDIAKAKAEILLGVKKGGYAILNKDNKYFDFLSNKSKELGLKTLSFSESLQADAKLLNFIITSTGSIIEIELFGKKVSYSLGSSGIHLAKNSLSVVLAIHAAAGNVSKAIENLINFKEQKGRGQRLSVKKNGKDFLLLDESYNASPIAVKAALKSMGEIKIPGRKLAILGDMLELGELSQDFHDTLAKEIEINNIDKIITIGSNMKKMARLLTKNKVIASYDNTDELIKDIDKYIENSDLLLIKGSLGMKTYKLVEFLVN